MHLVTDPQHPLSVAGANVAEVSAVNQFAYSDCRIIRRNGAEVNFDTGKIAFAISKAFFAIGGGQSAASARIREVVAWLFEGVDVLRRTPPGPTSVKAHQGAPRWD
ncbi:MAG: hypothetical protein ABIH03_16575 [Pseudomonadota bacterium]